MILTQRSYKILCILILSCWIASDTLAQNTEEVYADKIHQKHVKTVQLYPATNAPDREMSAPIVSLDQSRGLILQFDLLQDNYSQLQARIIHCDADWTKSSLSDFDFLEQYNSVDIRDFDYSVNTKMLYVNYRLQLPKVKISGNYVVQVFQNNNTSDVLFAKRFIVFENMVGINPTVRVSTSVSDRRSNHQIDFDIVYQRLRVSNPLSEFKVVIRQNQRWDNAIVDIKPTLSNRGNSILEYRHFNGENNFKAGSEFRFIDLRTFSFRGRFISRLDQSSTPMKAEVSLGEVNGGKFYSEFRDMNGNYFIQTLEAGADYLEADYLNVKFQLKADPISEAVYLLGAFNLWNKDDESIMQYDATNGVYFRNILLKQGMYDYQYWVDGADPLLFESSFYQAGNTYEIIVYHKSFTDQSEKVVGYKSFVGKL